MHRRGRCSSRPQWCPTAGGCGSSWTLKRGTGSPLAQRWCEPGRGCATCIHIRGSRARVHGGIRSHHRSGDVVVVAGTLRHNRCAGGSWGGTGSSRGSSSCLASYTINRMPAVILHHTKTEKHNKDIVRTGTKEQHQPSRGKTFNVYTSDVRGWMISLSSVGTKFTDSIASQQITPDGCWQYWRLAYWKPKLLK